MARIVRIHEYGDPSVLKIEDIDVRLRAIPGVTGVAFGYFPPNADGGEAQVEVQGQAVKKVS